MKKNNNKSRTKLRLTFLDKNRKINGLKFQDLIIEERSDYLHRDMIDALMYSLTYSRLLTPIGTVTPIYVKWRWLDKILVKLFNPIKKIK